MLRPIRKVINPLLRSLFTRPSYLKSSSSQSELKFVFPDTSVQNYQDYDFQDSEDKMKTRKEPLRRQAAIEDMTVHDVKYYINPKHQDILLSDLNETILYERLSIDLDVKYLSSAAEPFKPLITGILYGDYLRPIVNMPCSYKNKYVNIFFIVDTGCPHTFISSSAFKALGVDGNRPSYIEINGLKANVEESHSHFKDCCVVGANFLSKHKLILECNYATDEVIIKPS